MPEVLLAGASAYAIFFVLFFGVCVISAKLLVGRNDWSKKRFLNADDNEKGRIIGSVLDGW